MSSTGRVDEGIVTQDDATLDGGNDDLGYLTDTDPEIRAGTIEAMRRADVVLRANGRGTRAERRAARRRGMEEDDLNGETEEEEEEGWGGRDAHDGVVAESGRSPSRSLDRSRGRSRRSRSGSRGRSRKGSSRD